MEPLIIIIIIVLQRFDIKEIFPLKTYTTSCTIKIYKYIYTAEYIHLHL